MLITGASGGVGSAVARHAVAAGYRTALLARGADKLAAIVDEVGPAAAVAVSADVTDWIAVSKAVDGVAERLGGIDGAVINAGIALSASFFGHGGADPDEWQSMVLTNVLGTALSARAVLPRLEESGGHLVIMGSVSGRIMRPGLYSATKWAVSALAASVRAEAVGTGVRVTVIQPGVIDTGILRDELRQRPMLDPDDVARAVMFVLDQPPTVDVNEIVLRPVGQPADC
ncbi:SDR family oxidoreductase [Nocardia sp. NPDC059239]|uniref:SDR family oxidoreductase n=1 Tax=Nocardia sp. NPDC059239 TaxID=3346785 RepID=UPI00368F2588